MAVNDGRKSPGSVQRVRCVRRLCIYSSVRTAPRLCSLPSVVSIGPSSVLHPLAIRLRRAAGCTIDCRVCPHLLDMVNGDETNDVEAAVMRLHTLSVHIDTRTRFKITEADAIAPMIKFLNTVREDRITDAVTDCLTNLGWPSS